MELKLEIKTWNCHLKLSFEIETWNWHLKPEIETWNWTLKLKLCTFMGPSVFLFFFPYGPIFVVEVRFKNIFGTYVCRQSTTALSFCFWFGDFFVLLGLLGLGSVVHILTKSLYLSSWAVSRNLQVLPQTMGITELKLSFYSSFKKKLKAK